MRTRTIAACLAVGLACALAGESGAILIRHDRDEAEHRALAEKFPAACRVLPDGAGTLVAPRWVITAAHVAQGAGRRGGTVRCGDGEYDIGKVFLHPDWKGREHDVGLLKLDRPVAGIEPAALYDKDDEVGKLVTFVGNGDFGTGETGPQRKDGVRRGATNRVDEADADWIFFTFDRPERATRLEGISGPGDSGGPALLEQDGRLWIVGVSSAGMSPRGRAGRYGSRELYTRVSTHLGWLRRVLEEDPPAAGAAPGFSGAGAPEELARRRARAFLDAYGSGDDATIAAFFEDHMARGDDRPPVEQRVAGIRRLHERWGELELLETIVAPLRVEIVCRAGGETLTFGLELQAEPPHRIDQVFLDVGGPPGGGRRASIPPPDATVQGELTPRKLARLSDDWLGSLAEDGAFSGVVLMARDGEPFFHEAYGLASRRYDAPNRVDTRFNVGSITKSFTKVAVGQLLQAGKLSLDDTLDRHLPGYPNPGVARRITIGQLLEHTSGLGDIFNDRYASTPKDRMREPADFFFLFADEPLLFEPGERQQYSNAGYIVLGAVVEAVSGMSYRDYIQRHVFDPAGMSGSGFFALDDPVPNLAEGYTGRGCPGERACRSSRFMLNFQGCPAGGSYSPAADLLRFDRALREHRLLRPQYTTWYFTGEIGTGQAAAAGPVRAPLGVAGGAPGVTAALDSDGELTIVVLANQDPPASEEIARHLRRLARGLPAS